MDQALGFLYVGSSLFFGCLWWQPPIERDSLFPRIRQMALGVLAASLLFFVPIFVVGLGELWIGWPSISMVSIMGAQVLALVLGRYLGLVGRPIGRRGRRFTTPAMLSPTTATFLIACLVFMLISVSLLLGFPRGYEVQAYHLPLAVHYFESGSLHTWDEAYMHAFPANMSLFAGVLLKTIPERLVSIANIPFLGLACFACYGLARCIGAAPRPALLCAIGISTIPVVAFSAMEIGADVAGMSFLGLAFLVLLSTANVSVGTCFLAGAAAGLAFGFKSVHLVGATILGLAVMFLAARSAPSRWIGAVRAGAVYSAGFGCLAGVWLVRNVIDFGNPLYPVHIAGIFDMLGWQAAPDIDYLSRTETQFEWVRQPAEWLVYPWVEWHRINQNFKHSSGFGAFFAAAVIPSLAAASFDLGERAIASCRGAVSWTGEAARTAILLLGGLMIVATWWILVDRQPRYLMGGIILVTPIAARYLTGLSGRSRSFAYGTTVTSILIMLFVIAAQQGMEFGSRFIASSHLTRATFYEYPQEIDSLPQPATVMNAAGRSQNYAVFGSKLSNRVVTDFAVVGEFRDSFEDRVEVTEDELSRFDVTHIYSIGPMRLDSQSCLELQELDRIDTNPSNGVRLKYPRLLYEVKRCSLPMGLDPAERESANPSLLR